jgi:hypothetical protein
LLIVASRGVDGTPETDADSADTIPAAKVGELRAEELDDDLESLPPVVGVRFSSYCTGGDDTVPVPDWQYISLSSSSMSLSTNSGLVTERECLPIVGKYIPSRSSHGLR